MNKKLLKKEFNSFIYFFNKELEEKKMPFIIKRPMPNGGCEYWKLSDLEILI
jgi:hypothetical protein